MGSQLSHLVKLCIVLHETEGNCSCLEAVVEDAIYSLEVSKRRGSSLVVENETEGVFLHAMDIEGDDGDPANGLPDPRLPQVPSSVEEGELGGEVSIGESPGQ